MTSPDGPTDAELSRTLTSSKTFGSLATMSVECPGFPFGSLVAFGVDDSGRPLLCLSAMAEHSRNMAADPKASLMVTEYDGSDDLLALARVTLVGEMAKIDGDERQTCLDRYLVTHPGAYYTGFHDFAVYRLEVTNVRYVGGFARMSWVSAGQYATAEPDPLAQSAAGIIAHMNDDHADALVAYCRVFGDVEATSAVLVGVDRYGMNMRAEVTGADTQWVRVNFPERADTTDAVRKQTVALLRDARAQTSS